MARAQGFGFDVKETNKNHRVNKSILQIFLDLEINGKSYDFQNH